MNREAWRSILNWGVSSHSESTSDLGGGRREGGNNPRTLCQTNETNSVPRAWKNN